MFVDGRYTVQASIQCGEQFKIYTIPQKYPFDVFKSPISGGSLVLLFSKEKIEKSNLLKKMEFDEKKLKINSLENWKKFGKKSIIHANKFKNDVIKIST